MRPPIPWSSNAPGVAAATDERVTRAARQKSVAVDSVSKWWPFCHEDRTRRSEGCTGWQLAVRMGLDVYVCNASLTQVLYAPHNPPTAKTMAYDTIFSPLQLRSLKLKNRILRSNAAGRFDQYDGSGAQPRINWELKFARGGVGAIISSFVPVHPRGNFSSQ